MPTISFYVADTDIPLLDELAGPRGRSKWLRRVVRVLHASKVRERQSQPRRKASTTPRKTA